MRLGDLVEVEIPTTEKRGGVVHDIVVKKVGLVSAINHDTVGLHIYNPSYNRPVVYCEADPGQIKVIAPEKGK